MCWPPASTFPPIKNRCVCVCVFSKSSSVPADCPAQNKTAFFVLRYIYIYPKKTVTRVCGGGGGLSWNRHSEDIEGSPPAINTRTSFPIS